MSCVVVTTLTEVTYVNTQLTVASGLELRGNASHIAGNCPVLVARARQPCQYVNWEAARLERSTRRRAHHVHVVPVQLDPFLDEGIHRRRHHLLGRRRTVPPCVLRKFGAASGV